jgi:hypothetical protein
MRLLATAVTSPMPVALLVSPKDNLSPQALAVLNPTGNFYHRNALLLSLQPQRPAFLAALPVQV